MQEALFYKKLNDNKVECLLCNHNCLIPLGKRGICQVRENQAGKLYSLVYGKVIAANLDPIEKKPLFHFYPASLAYSIASLGCNFRCLNCQNWSISQGQDLISKQEESFTAQDIIEAARAFKAKSIAYTYTEPTVFYEYVLDIAKLAKDRGLKSVFISNGYITEEPLRKIAPYLDAANIDLKGISEDFYQKVCGAKLKPVLDSIKLFYQLGIWLEITTLLIPGYNDSIEDLEKIAKFIKNIDKSIPWHISAFHPDYKMKNIKPTSLEVMKQALAIGKKIGLDYVYQGNVGQGENTYCPKCNKLLIERRGFLVNKNNIQNNNCPFCGQIIQGRWDVN